MASKTVGFVGYGSIGQATAKMVKAAFGCRIVVLRRQAGAGDPSGLADEVLGFDEREKLFRTCDFIVCSLPKTPDTIDFVGPAELGVMKSSAVLISIGRGAVVDETALVTALAENRIRGAALDVFAHEPLPPSSPFWRLDNVLLTPHNADYTEDYQHLGWKIFAENAARFTRDQPLATVVDVKHGY